MPTFKVTVQKIDNRRHFHISFRMRSSQEAPSLFPDPIRTRPSDDRKTGATQNNELISRRLSRLCMRHPNAGVKTHLANIHRKLGEILASRSDKEILWLLAGNGHCSRGGFRTPEQVRKFLSLPVGEMTTSALITQIETLVTAIAYRGVDMPGTPHPIRGDPEEQNMRSLCQQIVSQKVPPIAASFPTRQLDSTEDVFNTAIGRLERRPRGKQPMRTDDILVDRAEISDASDVEEDCQLPRERLPGRRFAKYHFDPDQDPDEKSELSFLGKSRRDGIPIRSHIGLCAFSSCCH